MASAAAAAVVAPRSITLERLQKALSAHYLTHADTNIRGIHIKERAPVISMQCKPIPDLARPPYCEATRDSVTWAPISLGHAFGPTWSTHWMCVCVCVPAHWRAREDAGECEAYLHFDSNCEAMVYTEDGRVVQGLTGGDADQLRGNRRAEVLLRDLLRPDGSATLYVEVACNGLFGAGAGGMINAPDPARTFTLATCELMLVDKLARQLLWDYIVMVDLAEKAPSGSYVGERALTVANAVLNSVDQHDRSTIPRAAAIARSFFTSPATHTNGTAEVVAAIGHCHIDTAWLWSFAETRRKVARSWASQLRYMDTVDPRFVFTASQMVQYEWLQKDYPEVFARLVRAVARGAFAPVGGTWVEPDANMPSGEALVRQFLYGTQFLRDRLGDSMVASARARAQHTGAIVPPRIPHANGTMFLPDTFGYCPQFPQIIRGCGMRYFLTQKLSWSLINKPEHNTFWWNALDGSSVLVHFPPADNYNAQADVADVLRTCTNNKDKGRTRHSMMLFGNGDGGGGPTLPMFEQLHRLGVSGVSLDSDLAGDSAVATTEQCALTASVGDGGRCLPGFPRVEYTTPLDFFDSLACDAAEYDVVTWDGELYLELHQGTLTSQAWIKCANRRCERELQDAEAAWALAVAIGAAPFSTAQTAHAALRAAWSDLLVCQFHDVLPGSSIHEVYKDSRRMLQRVLTLARDSAAAATGALLRLLADAPSDRPADVLFNFSGTGRHVLLETGTALSVSAMPAIGWVMVPPDARLHLGQPTDAFEAPKPVTSGKEAKTVVVHSMDEVHSALAAASASASSGHPAAVTVLRWEPLRAVAAAAKRGMPNGQLELIDAALEAQPCIILDNGQVQVWISCVSGQVLRMRDVCVDGVRPRELIALELTDDGKITGGNRFQLHSDVPWFWDAWDTFVYRDEKFAIVGADAAARPQVSLISAEPSHARVRIEYAKVGRASRLTQDVILRAGGKLVEFETFVDWHESHVMMRVSFPLQLRCSTATYQTQYGCIARPTHTNTSRDVMQYEVCAHEWADLSEPDYGVTLINDCKYGYACRGNTLSLSLLRSPKSPDPGCDMGPHHFRYGILCHADHVRACPDATRAAREFNTSVRRHRIEAAREPGTGLAEPVPSHGVILQAVHPSRATTVRMRRPVFSPLNKHPVQTRTVAVSVQIVLDTLKLAEDGSGHLVARLYESMGSRASARLRTPFKVLDCSVVNLLEEDPLHEGLPTSSENAAAHLLSCAPPAVGTAFARHAGPDAPIVSLQDETSIVLECHPFQIVTIRLVVARPA